MAISRRKAIRLAGASSVAIVAGISSTVATATPAAAEIDTFEFMSVNFPDWFIRHRNFLGELSRQYTSDPPGDFSFKLLSWPPLGPGEPERVALESTNIPGGYRLRHKFFRIVLEKSTGPGDQLFLADSTFYLELNRFGFGGVSFRSVNYPDRYLRHRDFQLWVEPWNSPNLAADASFIKYVRID